MPLPSPRDLAMAIAQTSFSDEEKRDMLKALPKMKEQEIIDLYELLLKVSEEEKRFIQQVDLIDLKYQVQLQEALKAKT